MGHYGVDLLLKDRELMSHVAAHILCANDLVAAWGGLRFLGELGLDVDCVSGPATDNSAGVDYIEQRFGMRPPTAAPTRALADMVEAQGVRRRARVIAATGRWPDDRTRTALPLAAHPRRRAGRVRLHRRRGAAAAARATRCVEVAAVTAPRTPGSRSRACIRT